MLVDNNGVFINLYMITTYVYNYIWNDHEQYKVDGLQTTQRFSLLSSPMNEIVAVGYVGN